MLYIGWRLQGKFETDHSWQWEGYSCECGIKCSVKYSAMCSASKCLSCTGSAVFCGFVFRISDASEWEGRRSPRRGRRTYSPNKRAQHERSASQGRWANGGNLDWGGQSGDTAPPKTKDVGAVNKTNGPRTPRVFWFLEGKWINWASEPPIDGDSGVPEHFVRA